MRENYKYVLIINAVIKIFWKKKVKIENVGEISEQVCSSDQKTFIEQVLQTLDLLYVIFEEYSRPTNTQIHKIRWEMFFFISAHVSHYI